MAAVIRAKSEIWLWAASALLALSACNEASDSKISTKADAAQTASSDRGLAASAPLKAADIMALAQVNADLSSFVSASEAAGLGNKLREQGDYTVFAPANGAFAKLPDDNIAELIKPANKADLASIISLHILPERWDSITLAQKVRKSGGKLELTTISGEKLFISGRENALILTGPRGNKARITLADQTTGNGTLHMIDSLLLPPEKPETVSDTSAISVQE